MSRIADSDWLALNQYIDSYRIPPELGAQARSALLRRAHRHVLAALQVWDCIVRLGESGQGLALGASVERGSEALDFIGEYFSDLAGVMACMLHGLYKPANMQLRSAVESFVRGLSSIYSLEARSTTSVYRLFELAAAQPPFQGASAPDFATLNQVYGDLCLHVHSATLAHRAGVHYVSAHMKHDTSKMREIVVLLDRINRAALSILVRSNGALYTSSSARVRDVLDEVIPTPVRVHALGG